MINCYIVIAAVPILYVYNNQVHGHRTVLVIFKTYPRIIKAQFNQHRPLLLYTIARRNGLLEEKPPRSSQYSSPSYDTVIYIEYITGHNHNKHVTLNMMEKFVSLKDL